MSGKKAISFRDRACAKEIAVCGLVSISGLVSIIMRGVTVTVDRLTKRVWGCAWPPVSGTIAIGFHA